ncbi:hypothetical protein ABH926_008931 [Catenulispora sp. GP43]|uniref:hypothetical protein n=1 Tax=Catenulispora sp. GP43 TaxID=3156263 RepID=UPI00351842E8
MSSPDLYDANQPSGGLTIDTTGGPVDMVAVLRHISGETGIDLTAAETAVARTLDPSYYRYSARSFTRAAAYERLARTLYDVA